MTDPVRNPVRQGVAALTTIAVAVLLLVLGLLSLFEGISAVVFFYSSPPPPTPPPPPPAARPPPPPPPPPGGFGSLGRERGVDRGEVLDRGADGDGRGDQDLPDDSAQAADG